MLIAQKFMLFQIIIIIFINVMRFCVSKCDTHTCMFYEIISFKTEKYMTLFYVFGILEKAFNA